MSSRAPDRRQILTAQVGLVLGCLSLLAFGAANAVGMLRGFPTKSDTVVAGAMFLASIVGLVAAASARQESVLMRVAGAILSLGGLLVWGLVIMGQGI